MQKPAAVIGGIALVSFSVLSIVLSVLVSTERAMTPLETTLFAILTFVLSTLGSVLVSAYYAKIQSYKNYGQLARPALRRVVALNKSAEQIIEALAAKQNLAGSAEATDTAVVREWLDAVSRLLQQHAGQLDAAISDWKEILPDEYKELVAISELRTEIGQKLDQMQALSQEVNEDTKREAAKLHGEIVNLKKRLDRERSTWALPYESIPVGDSVRSMTISTDGKLTYSPGQYGSIAPFILSEEARPTRPTDQSFDRAPDQSRPDNT